MQTFQSVLNADQYQAYFAQGLTYEDYLADFSDKINRGKAYPYEQYLPLNWQRVQRIHKTFRLDAGLEQVIQGLQKPVYWLVVTEPWCGDASQIVPVIGRIAELSGGRIQLRFVLRDSNLELMDAHLTGTSRSIPKLVQLNERFEPVADWGARPKAAQELVVRLKNNPETAATYADELHKWYAQDHQHAIQAELGELLSQA